MNVNFSSRSLINSPALSTGVGNIFTNADSNAAIGLRIDRTSRENRRIKSDDVSFDKAEREIISR